MRRLLVLALVGCAAQLVDGASGMGYGLTSGTLLLSLGLTPVAVSASVHLSELVTNLASTLSHWRLGNVDWRVVSRLALPGMVGAFAGATVLAGLPAGIAAPIMAGLLTLLGGYVLVRTIAGRRTRRTGRPGTWLLAPLGLVAGFVDATGSGGWGPVATPALLAEGRLEPRRVVGSVDTSEIAISLAASVGFLAALGTAAVHWQLVAALVAGGVLAAPVAAYIVRILPGAVLGVVAGGMIIGSNLRTLLLAGHVGVGVRVPAYALVAALVLALLAVVIARKRRARSAPAPTALQVTTVGARD